MKLEIELDVPEDGVDEALRRDLARAAKEHAVLQLFAERRISSGLAARMLGIGRIQFLDLLKQRGVPFVVNLDDADIRLIRQWREQLAGARTE